MRYATSALVGLAVIFLLSAPAQSAVVMTANDRTDSGADNELDGTGGPVVLQTSGANTGIFDFADPNNDDSAADAIADGLDLAGFTLSQYGLGVNAAGVNDLVLDLNGGNIVDTGGTGIIRTYNASHYGTPSLYIQNAGSITAATITTNTSGNPNGGQGRIEIDHSGNFNVGTVSNKHDTWGSAESRGIHVYGDGLGALAIDVLQSHGGVLQNGVDIQHYTGVNISTTFTAYSFANWVNPDDVQIINIGSGGVILPEVDISYKSTAGQNPASHLTVSTTGNVGIFGDVLTYMNGSYDADTNGGNVFITAGDLLLIQGILDQNSNRGDANDGYAELTTTSAAGSDPSIILGDSSNPGAQTFDLDRLMSILFDAANGKSVIYHTLSNFDGEGSTQFEVATPGDIVYYDDSANPGLLGGGPGNDGIYNIAGGGTLQPLSTAVPEPATLALLGLGGLATAGGAVRRRRR